MGDSDDPYAPMRLADAVAKAFPHGGMTESGLRREIGRGRLEVEVIAGKQFVTLAGINRMRELCRVPASWRPPTPTQACANQPDLPSSSAQMTPQDALRIRLLERRAAERGK